MYHILLNFKIIYLYKVKTIFLKILPVIYLLGTGESISLDQAMCRVIPKPTTQLNCL